MTLNTYMLVVCLPFSYLMWDSSLSFFFSCIFISNNYILIYVWLDLKFNLPFLSLVSNWSFLLSCPYHVDFFAWLLNFEIKMLEVHVIHFQYYLNSLYHLNSSCNLKLLVLQQIMTLIRHHSRSNKLIYFILLIIEF